MDVLRLIVKVERVSASLSPVKYPRKGSVERKQAEYTDLSFCNLAPQPTHFQVPTLEASVCFDLSASRCAITSRQVFCLWLKGNTCTDITHWGGVGQRQARITECGSSTLWVSAEWKLSNVKRSVTDVVKLTHCLWLLFWWHGNGVVHPVTSQQEGKLDWVCLRGALPVQTTITHSATCNCGSLLIHCCFICAYLLEKFSLRWLLAQ